MTPSKRFISSAVILFGIGGISLYRFSPDVRTVAVVGLVGAGGSFGVAFVFLALGLRGKIKE